MVYNQKVLTDFQLRVSNVQELLYVIIFKGILIISIVVDK